MANLGVKVRAIAWTTVQEAIRKRVLFLIVLLLVLVVGITVTQMATVTMATNAGETEVVQSIHAGIAESILGIWTFATTVLALYLGAIAMASEVSGKTLVNVLSRPVEHATYLAGRWIGTLAFLFAFQLTGVLIAMVSVHYYAIEHNSLLWLGYADAFAAAVCLSGVSLGLSTAMSPMAAGTCTILLKLVPMILGDQLKHPRWILRGLARAAYYLSPASMPVDLIHTSFNRSLAHPAYALYAQVLGENILYGVVVVAIGCMIFARREVKLR